MSRAKTTTGGGSGAPTVGDTVHYAGADGLCHLAEVVEASGPLPRLKLLNEVGLPTATVPTAPDTDAFEPGTWHPVH